MKNILLLALFSCFQLIAFAQKRLVKDIDGDGKKDSIYIDKEFSIVCRLSSQNFIKLKSKPMEISTDNSYIQSKPDGFEISINWMRFGYACQFRYEKGEKRIRAIGMSEYAFGNAANDGSGEASVNLLTGDYIGDWNYFDHLANNENGELVKIPTIKAKLQFMKIYLEEFNEDQYYAISDQLRPLVEKQKNLERKRRAKTL